jgi:hypothetical protein
MVYAQMMLPMRARSWAIRDGFSDVLRGLGIVEEIQNLPSEAKNKAVDSQFLDDDPANARSRCKSICRKGVMSKQPRCSVTTPRRKRGRNNCWIVKSCNAYWPPRQGPGIQDGAERWRGSQPFG